MEAARCDWLKPLVESASVFLNIRLLSKIGFINDFGKGINATRMQVTDPLIQAEKVNAYHMFNL